MDLAIIQLQVLNLQNHGILLTPLTSMNGMVMPVNLQNEELEQ